MCLDIQPPRNATAITKGSGKMNLGLFKPIMKLHHLFEAVSFCLKLVYAGRFY